MVYQAVRLDDILLKNTEVETPTLQATIEVEGMCRDHWKGVTKDWYTSCSTWIGIKKSFLYKETMNRNKKDKSEVLLVISNQGLEFVLSRMNLGQLHIATVKCPCRFNILTFIWWICMSTVQNGKCGSENSSREIQYT